MSICHYCNQNVPAGCDCWKMSISPRRREDLQRKIAEDYLARKNRQDGLGEEGVTLDEKESLLRGQFGNQKAKFRRTA
jgi:hypothetical protein